MLLSYLRVIYRRGQPDAALTGVVVLPANRPDRDDLPRHRPRRPGWQIITTALLTALAIWALMRTAGRICTGALPRFRGRIPLRELLRYSTT